MTTTVVNVRGLLPSAWLADPSHAYHCHHFRGPRCEHGPHEWWPRSPFLNPFNAGLRLNIAKMQLWRAGADAEALATFLTRYHGVKQLDAEMAIDCYRIWLPTQPELMERLPGLKGKTLGCRNAPRLCHCQALRDMVMTL